MAVDKSRQLVELGEDVSFTRTVGTPSTASSKLTIGFEQIDIVAADEILRHPDNRRIQTRLTMMVRGMLGYIPAELRDLDFRFQTPLLKRRKEDFTQRDFQPIHQVRNRTLIVVDREVDKPAVNKLFIRNLRLRCIQVRLARIRRQPLFPVIRALLIERHIQAVIREFASMDELHHLLILEVFFELLARART